MARTPHARLIDDAAEQKAGDVTIASLLIPTATSCKLHAFRVLGSGSSESALVRVRLPLTVDLPLQDAHRLPGGKAAVELAAEQSRVAAGKKARATLKIHREWRPARCTLKHTAAGGGSSHILSGLWDVKGQPAYRYAKRELAGYDVELLATVSEEEVGWLAGMVESDGLSLSAEAAQVDLFEVE